MMNRIALTIILFFAFNMAIGQSISPATNTICVGTSYTYARPVSGPPGGWFSSNPSIASVAPLTGVVTALATGTVTITYNFPGPPIPVNYTGTLTVIATPVALSAVATPNPVCAGTAVTLSGTSTVGATSRSWSGPLGFYAGTATTTFTPGSSAATGLYTFTTSNSCGSTSISVVLMVHDPITGVTAIASPNPACAGSSVTLTGVSAGATTYSWADPGAAIMGTTPSLSFTPSTSAASGSYVFTATNACGSVSASASLQVDDPITGVTATGFPNLVCAGSSVTLTGAATGATTYSWADPGSTVIATTTSLSFTPGSSAESGSYTFTASNACGSVSASALLQIDDPLTSITGSVTPVVVCAGSPVTFSGSAPGATSYSWTDPMAAVISTSATFLYTPSSSTASGIYMFNAANACGSLIMLVALQVDDPITGVTATASPVPVYCGSALTLAGTASGATSDLWTGPGGFSSPGTTVTVTASGASAGVYTYTATNACGSISATTLAVALFNQWQGTVSTDWFDASNWSCIRVPVATDNVYIPSFTPYTPEVNATAIAVSANLVMDDNNILIDANSTLNIGGSVTVNNTTGAPAFNLSASTAVMTIQGDITSAGPATTKILGQGYATLNGTVLQTFYGNINVDFMEINNNSGADIGNSTGSSQITIDNTLKLTSGTLTTNSGTYGKLILNSQSASGSVLTARVDAIPSGGGSISGTVYCYQYIPGGYRTYIFWSHPFSTPTTLSQLMDASVVDGINITGTGTVQGVTPASIAACFDGAVSSAYWYNTTTAAWVGFQSACTTATSADQLKQYQGIRVWYRGARPSALYWNSSTPPPSPAVISQWGPVNQGNQNVTLSKVGSSDYNMLGNPYPSPVDIGTICYNDRANLTGTNLWVWDPTLGTLGLYRTISFSTGSAAIPYYLPANCAFQVRAASNGVQLHFQESNKTSSITHPSLMYRKAPEALTLNIYDANYHLYDLLNVKFDDNATSDEDNNYDAGKIIGEDFGFYSKSADGHNLSIDVRPYSSGNSIPLVLHSQYEQEFIIKAEGLSMNAAGLVYLHDKLLNKYTLMEPGAEYKFTFKNDAESASKHCIFEDEAVDNFALNENDDKSVSSNRFELKMVGNSATMNNNNTGLSVTLSPNPAKEEVSVIYSAVSNSNTTMRILDVTGKTLITKELGQNQNGNIAVPIKDLAIGVYIVELVSGKDRAIQKLVKQ